MVISFSIQAVINHLLPHIFCFIVFFDIQRCSEKPLMTTYNLQESVNKDYKMDIETLWKKHFFNSVLSPSIFELLGAKKCQ